MSSVGKPVNDLLVLLLALDHQLFPLVYDHALLHLQALVHLQALFHLQPGPTAEE